MATPFLKVNNTPCPAPSRFEWGLEDINGTDSGRTMDGIEHINRISQKEIINLEWVGLSGAMASTILTLFNSKYFTMTYRSPLSNAMVTKEFTRSNPSAPLFHSVGNSTRIERISFSVKER